MAVLLTPRMESFFRPVELILQLWHGIMVVRRPSLLCSYLEQSFLNGRTPNA